MQKDFIQIQKQMPIFVIRNGNHITHNLALQVCAPCSVSGADNKKMNQAKSLLMEGRKIKLANRHLNNCFLMYFKSRNSKNILEFWENFENIKFPVTWILQFNSIHLLSDHSEPGTVHTPPLTIKI